MVGKALDLDHLDDSGQTGLHNMQTCLSRSLPRGTLVLCHSFILGFQSWAVLALATVIAGGTVASAKTADAHRWSIFSCDSPAYWIAFSRSSSLLIHCQSPPTLQTGLLAKLSNCCRSSRVLFAFSWSRTVRPAWSVAVTTTWTWLLRALATHKRQPRWAECRAIAISTVLRCSEFSKRMSCFKRSRCHFSSNGCGGHVPRLRCRHQRESPWRNVPYTVHVMK